MNAPPEAPKDPLLRPRPDLLRPVFWDKGALRLLDQRLLPGQEVWLCLDRPSDIARAIRQMAVRGAPAIGVAAAYGQALFLREAGPGDAAARFSSVRELLSATRPTAVNLFWALDRMERRFLGLAGQTAEDVETALLSEAHAIATEDIAACRAIGRHGAALLGAESTVLTHCNAGGLATAGYGTALGVVRGAVEAGKSIRVLADETRPYLQGARLTAWELAREGIAVELITDGMAGHFLSRGAIDAVIVGADRIARNGDTANKIGTYTLAVLARENGVPFYVAAPTTTVDLACPDGASIPIEERASEEAASIAGTRIAPEGVFYRHPAFDVTPARLITAIVLETGVARPPDQESLARLAAPRAARN
jgi:methylthioribose-1-phosphate isomerase